MVREKAGAGYQVWIKMNFTDGMTGGPVVDEFLEMGSCWRMMGSTT